MVYMTEEEIKQNEWMIMRNNICKSTKDINKIIEEFLKDTDDKAQKKPDDKAKKKSDEKAKKKPDEKYMYQNERQKGNNVQ